VQAQLPLLQVRLAPHLFPQAPQLELSLPWILMQPLLPQSASEPGQTHWLLVQVLPPLQSPATVH